MKCKDCQHYGEICDVSKTPPDSWCKQYLDKLTPDDDIKQLLDDYFKEAK
jgi:hypothetical protein